jgi:hypothetical protein
MIVGNDMVLVFWDISAKLAHSLKITVYADHVLLPAKAVQ